MSRRKRKKTNNKSARRRNVRKPAPERKKDVSLAGPVEGGDGKINAAGENERRQDEHERISPQTANSRLQRATACVRTRLADFRLWSKRWEAAAAFLFGCGLVMFTLGQVIVGAFQWRAIDNQHSAMLAQNKLASRAIDTSKESAERQLRAYVTVVTNERTQLSYFTKEHRFSFELKIKNAGQTPANKAKVHIRTLYVDASDSDGPGPDSAKQVTNMLIGPGQEVTLLTQRKLLTESDQEAHRTRQKMAWVIGRVDYEDAFGGNRFITFKMKQGKPLPSTDNDIEIFDMEIKDSTGN